MTAGDSLRREIARVYYLMCGGIPDAEFPAGLFKKCPGEWDVQVGGIAVELDEAQHFNPFRLLTLDSSIYARPSTIHDGPFRLDKYKEWCVDRLDRCVEKSYQEGYWTKPHPVRQFGPLRPAWSEIQELRRRNDVAWVAATSPPRWKQRAFYDFVKDAYPFLRPGEIAVARLSIYDMVPIEGVNRLVEELLEDPRDAYAEPIWNVLKERSKSIAPS